VIAIALLAFLGIQALSLDDALADSGIMTALEYIEGQRDETAVFLAEVGAVRSPSGEENERAERVVGPGTHTASTTAAMLMAAEAIVVAGLVPEHDLIFAAVAQEETRLVGMKNLYRGLGDRAFAYVDVLGDGRRTPTKSPCPRPRLCPSPFQTGARAGVEAPLRLWKAMARGSERGRAGAGARAGGQPSSRMNKLFSDSENVVGGDTEMSFALEAFQLTPGGQIPGAQDSELVTSSEAIARHLGFEQSLVTEARRT
jgi:hypothetical protein